MISRPLPSARLRVARAPREVRIVRIVQSLRLFEQLDLVFGWFGDFEMDLRLERIEQLERIEHFCSLPLKDSLKNSESLYPL